MTFVPGMKYYLPNATRDNLGTDFYPGLLKDYLDVEKGKADHKEIVDRVESLVMLKNSTGDLAYESQSFNSGEIQADADTMKSVRERNAVAQNGAAAGASWADKLASNDVDIFVDWSSVAKYRASAGDTAGKAFNSVESTSHIARVNIRRYVSASRRDELLKQAMRKNVNSSNEELSDSFEFLISAAGSPNWYSTQTCAVRCAGKPNRYYKIMFTQLKSK